MMTTIKMTVFFTCEGVRVRVLTPKHTHSQWARAHMQSHILPQSCCLSLSHTHTHTDTHTHSARARICEATFCLSHAVSRYHTHTHTQTHRHTNTHTNPPHSS